MNIFKLFKLSKAALKREDELSLAYLNGNKSDELPHLIDSNTRIKGVFLRSVLFFYFVVKKIKIKNKKIAEEDVLIYARTQNQLNSLISTIDGLTELNIKRYLLLDNDGLKGGQGSINLVVSPKVALVSFLLYFYHFLPLYIKLKNKNKNKEINFSFNVFCHTYMYIPVFLSLFENKSIKLIVMSNDHNVDNRCLRLVGEILEIETLYMQHASVSELFPPLWYNYALLDGEIAFNTYRRCSSINSLRDRYHTNVFLSGQKKEIKVSSNIYGNTIGVAVNILDNIESVVKLLDVFIKKDYTIIVRTHPRQSMVFINNLKKYLAGHNLVTWSDSNEDSLVCFFSSVSCIIAANSSIHLEAGLAGIPTMYYEFEGYTDKSDYYGYVKNGISFKLDSNELIHSFKCGVEYCNSPTRNGALKKYSESYKTKWEFKEGFLSALLIKSILRQEDSHDFFYNYYSDDLFTAYKIKSEYGG